MGDKVRWGVISTALIGTQKVVPAMQRAGNVVVAAIASRDGAKARAAADALGIATAHASYEALLADPDIDAIYNPLPNHLHVPWTIRALEAGKHVLCEKPVGLDAAEARRLVEARDRTGRLVAEAFMVRHHPQWRRVRELVDAGRIGEARAVQTFFSYFNEDAANIRNQADIGGGGLYDIGCYAVVTARHVFAAEPVRVVALVERDPVFGTDRLTSGMAEFPGGRQLTFTCSTRLARHQRVTVAGTQGRIEVDVPFNAEPARVSTVRVDDARDVYGGGQEVIAFDPVDQYTLQGEAFSRAVLGQAPLEWPIEDAVANMAVIDALFRSAASGRWETV